MMIDDNNKKFKVLVRCNLYQRHSADNVIIVIDNNGSIKQSVDQILQDVKCTAEISR